MFTRFITYCIKGYVPPVDCAGLILLVSNGKVPRTLIHLLLSGPKSSAVYDHHVIYLSVDA